MAAEQSTNPFDSTERRALADLVRSFTARKIAPDLAKWENAGEIPLSVYRDLADTGILGIGFPEDLGGSGGDSIDTCIVAESMLGAGGSGGAFAGLFSLGIAIPHVIDAVRARQASGDTEGVDWLIDNVASPVLAGEKLAALGVTEPDGGSDVSNLHTRAIQDGADWIINGAKTYITTGARADVLVVAARTDAPGAMGISLFAVDTTTPGFEVVRRLDKMGWQCSDTAELAFTDMRVPTVALLTPNAGDGFASLSRHFAVERLSLAALAYSTAARSLELTLNWVKQRETFGRPLIKRQVVRHTLVEMYRRTDVAREYSRGVAIRHAAGQPVLLEAVLAKNTAVEACDWVVDKAVQLHGGMGYMRDCEVERHYRDARILGIGGGATEVMTDLAAKLLDY